MTRKAWLTLAVLTAALGPWLARARAQDQLRDYHRPILVLNTGGHHAPIRALLFTPDGSQLLTGGQDKVVNVWGLSTGKPRLEATIRPPIWRGAAGEIRALALAPTVDERGQRVLAVAGFGISGRRGNIGLYHLPAAGGIGTGDHFAELVGDDPKDDPNDPRPSGHANSVLSLAFDPTGTYLASGSIDSTARIWDWRNRRTTAILTGHAGGINAIAFTRDGTHLVTGGADGTLRLWDIHRPQAPIATAAHPPLNPTEPLGVQINVLAVSDDGKSVVVGREDGCVLRYDAANLANEARIVRGGESIEALALSHDSKRLVTSSIRRLTRAGELPRLTCYIRLHRFPDGATLRELPPFDSLAYACGFSPNDKVLAIAGGDRQSIRLMTNWDAPAAATVEVQSQGRSIWDVGLRTDGGRLAVGYSFDPNQNLMYGPRGPAVRPRYHGMNLPSREITSYDPADLNRGMIEYAGWTIRPVNPFQLEIVHAAPPQRTFQVTLDEVKDRRWKSYSFIPPGPDHPQPTVAVGCESGVWFYRLDNGRPTRLYAGHSGPVYCLAPSKDGRWLATGSSDQTVGLWTLAGCDTPPILGATFERGPDGLLVTAVEPFGFAEAMGLKKGDVAVKFGLARKEANADDFLAHYEEQLPNSTIELIVRRKVEPPPGQGQGQALAPPAAANELIGLYTSRRNSPALSLFVAEDREWVLWMPSGYYDTSIAGDTKFLGWHMNRGTLLEPKPSDYLEIIKFEKQLRMRRRSQPNKLDTLLATADPQLAAGIPSDLDRRLPPPPPPPPDRRLNPGGPAVAAAGLVRPAPAALPPVGLPVPAALVPGGAAAGAPPPGAMALGPGAPTPVAPTPDAGGPPVPVPAPPVPPAQQVARPDVGTNRLVPRPGAPASPELKLPVAPPLGSVARVPTPQPASPPVTPPAAAAPALAVEGPNRPQPEPGPAAPAAVTPVVAGVPARAPAVPDRPIQPARPQPAPLAINAAPARPLDPVLAPIPPGPAVAMPQPAIQPGRAVNMQAPNPLPPLEPAEFVELAIPPLLEPRIQPLPNQRITTLEGKPIDPRELPPDKIAIGDLDADGKGTLVLDMTIDADGRSPARSFDYLVDGRPIRPATIFDPPITLRHEAVKLSLAPGPHRFTAEVESREGIKRTISRDIFVRGLPAHRPTRLKLLTIAPAYQQSRIPAIEFAERDARDLRRFFGRHLVSPEDEKPLYSVDEEIREGATATAERVKKSIDALKDESLGEGDLVVIVIESHFIHLGAERSLVAADGMSIPPKPGIPADDLAKNLGALARQGCKVLVLLDTVHTASSNVWDTDVSDWVRNLRDEQNVIAFVASNSGPSKSLPAQGHRAFAQAVLDALKPPLIRENAYLLNDFRDVVIEQVLKLTERQQQAACYLPESINGQFPILSPQATGR
jgi:WD40 repeat protein